MLQTLKPHLAKLMVVLLIVLFILIYYLDAIFITIYPGQAGVLFHRMFNRGTVTDRVYGEGVNAIFPWDKMFVYDTRVQNLHQSVRVLSQNGLTIGVRVAVRYRPDVAALPKLHQEVGPQYQEKIIIPSTISAVREVIGKYAPEQLYATKRDIIQDEILIEAIEETGRLPIIYDAIIVESIELPEEINNAIEAKLRQEQKFLEYAFRIKREEAEVQRKKIEAEGINIYQRTVAKSLTKDLLRWKGIQASLQLAQSNNSKVVVFGGGDDGLPLILNTAETAADHQVSGTSQEGAKAQDDMKDIAVLQEKLEMLPAHSQASIVSKP